VRRKDVRWLAAPKVGGTLLLTSTTGFDAARAFASTRRRAGSASSRRCGTHPAAIGRTSSPSAPGRFGRLLLIIPVGEVAEILPEERVVVLHRSPRPTGTERRQDLREPLQPGGPRGAGKREAKGVGARAKHIEAQREVEAVIERLKHLIGLRRRKGGQREVTPDVEEPAEPSAEEPSAEEQAGEEAAAEEAPVEEAAEGLPAEGPTAGEPTAEEPPAEEQTTS
jgi:hypothetical protein